MKIAIYSGSIPSTTFIESLIQGVAEKHNVLLFGTRNESVLYSLSSIKQHTNSKKPFVKGIQTLYRLLLLLFVSPMRFKLIFEEIKQLNSWYEKYNRLNKIVSVLLYLPDVFHIQWAKDVEQWCFLKDKLKVKLILSLRGAHINYSPIADSSLAESYRKTFPKIDAFHAVSKAIALETQKYNAPEEKITVIHSPVQKEVFNAFKVYKKKDSTQIKVLSVGRFHWKKGYKYMVDAVDVLKKKHINIHYTIIASNQVSEDILFQINQLGLERDITILKGLSQSELFNKYHEFDALVLPSLEEGIANVVLEAMALGIPVISTNCGGMAEVVLPKETGWLVPVRSPQALSDAIIEVNKTAEIELQEVVKRAHEYVKTYFNAEDSIKKFLDLYVEVLQSN